MVFVAWRLPPKAAMPEHGAGVVEAKRNGGLDVFKAAVRLNLWHSNCLLNDGFFSFAVVRQVLQIIVLSV